MLASISLKQKGSGALMKSAWLVASVLAMVSLVGSGAWSAPQADELISLAPKVPCDRCEGTLLKGRTVQNPATRWAMISDLPESFTSHGVLYSTRTMLPDNGGAEELRRQRSADGFSGIDGGFDVFLFHLISKNPQLAARMVVYVTNLGDKPVTLLPRQVIKSEGIIGRVHEFESTLARRVLAEEWDRPLPRVEIPAGEGRVVAYGRQFGNVTTGPDASRNVNCFGYVRATVDGDAPASLQVDVIAVPPGPSTDLNAQAAALMETGAPTSDEVSMTQEPQGCALGRAVGVYPNFIWKNDAPFVLDALALDNAGTSFSMALPEVQTRGCPDARQTTDLVLRPGYTRTDTVGNYMIPYDVRLTVMNSSTTETVHSDVVFGKTGADIGLAWQLVVAEGVAPETETAALYDGQPVQTKWAGPKQATTEASLLSAPLELKPGQVKTICLRFLICGNSSLPFDLGVKRL